MIEVENFDDDQYWPKWTCPIEGCDDPSYCMFTLVERWHVCACRCGYLKIEPLVRVHLFSKANSVESET